MSAEACSCQFLSFPSVFWSIGRRWAGIWCFKKFRSGPSDTISVLVIDSRVFAVRVLLHQYFNVAFLMGKPQDLPAGKEQMKVGVALALITYVMALAVPYGLSRAILQAVIDLGCTALILFVALNLTGLRHRFEQAFGGLCGASAFINLSAVPLYNLRPGGLEAQGSSLSFFGDFILLVWGLSLLGHVIRHTFELSMVLSIIISFTYFILLSTLISSILPMPEVIQSTVSALDNALFSAIFPGQRLGSLG